MTKLTHRFRYPDRFVSGSLGGDDERVSFVQARHGTRLTNVICDPAQVLALAHHIHQMLNSLATSCAADTVPPAHEAPRDLDPLDLPLEPDFQAGTMTVTFLRADQALLIELFAEGGYDARNNDDGEGCTEVLEAVISLEQGRDFVARACSVILSGGLTCPQCRQSMHPSGHICPRLNGFRYPLFTAIAGASD